MNYLEFARKILPKIVLKNREKTITPFLYPFDYEVLNHIHNNKRSLIIKSRNMHMSTMYQIYVMWFLIYNEHTNNQIIIVGNRWLYDMIRVELSTGFNKNNKSFFYNGNILRFVNDLEPMIMQSTPYMVIFDEIKENKIKLLNYIGSYKVSVSSNKDSDDMPNSYWGKYMLHYNKNSEWTPDKLNTITKEIKKQLMDYD